MLGAASLEVLELITHILIAASITKKAALEDAPLGPEGLGTVECNQSLSLEPGAQMEEKKTSEISLGIQHLRELEKRLNPEKAVEEGREADHGETSALQDHEIRAEAMFLHEMVKWAHCLLTTLYVESSFC